MVFKRKETAAPVEAGTGFDAKMEEMRGRFHQLGAEREAAVAKLENLWTSREQLLAQIAPKMAIIEQEIERIRAPLYDIDRERGALVRALSGKTGRPEDYTS